MFLAHSGQGPLTLLEAAMWVAVFYDFLIILVLFYVVLLPDVYKGDRPVNEDLIN